MDTTQIDLGRDMDTNILNIKCLSMMIICLNSLPSYRNQSIDMHNKSIYWFLYDGSFAF